MPPKIVKLPYLRVSHVNTPEAPERPAPREPLIVHPPTLLSLVHQMRTASTMDEEDTLSGLWANDTEASALDGLWDPDEAAPEAPEDGFDIQFSQPDDTGSGYEGPNSRARRGARFRVDRYEPRASLVSRVREAMRPPPPERPVTPRPVSAPKPKAEPWPVRPKTPMERAAEYTNSTTSYRKKLLGD
jgi:hypothetical protein